MKKTGKKKICEHKWFVNTYTTDKLMVDEDDYVTVTKAIEIRCSECLEIKYLSK